MRDVNLAPLWRSSIGFDRLFDLIANNVRFDAEDNYPPYNILRSDEDTYRITLAVAGFEPDEITITAHQNMLTVTGRRAKEGEHHYLYQGISPVRASLQPRRLCRSEGRLVRQRAPTDRSGA